METHSSILAWKSHGQRSLMVQWVVKSWTRMMQLSTHASILSYSHPNYHILIQIIEVWFAQFVVRMKQTASLTNKQNGKRHPLKHTHTAIYNSQFVTKNVWKPILVDCLDIKELWEIGCILSLPYSIFIQKFLFYIYYVPLTRGFWVPVNQGKFANKSKSNRNFIHRCFSFLFYWYHFIDGLESTKACWKYICK